MVGLQYSDAFSRVNQYSHSATGQECFEMTCRGRRVLWRPFTFSGCSYI